MTQKRPVLERNHEDRWQAASDMQGTPIPGPHWLSVDLVQQCTLSSVLIDWETARSDDYWIEGKVNKDPETWGRVNCVRMEERIMKPPHIIDVLGCYYDSTGEGVTQASVFRLFINSTATKWGVSVWHLELYGSC